MTSSNGNIFRVTGHLCVEFTGPRWFPQTGEVPTQRPVTRSFDVFFDLRLNKRLSKQLWCWWFETLSRPLWRHRNDYMKYTIDTAMVRSGFLYENMRHWVWIMAPASSRARASLIFTSVCFTSNPEVNPKAYMSSGNINTLKPRQNDRHFADDTFKPVFVNENIRISIKISLKFVPKVPINNIPALVHIMARRRPGDKPLSKPMMVCLPTHICVTRPQWVKSFLSACIEMSQCILSWNIALSYYLLAIWYLRVPRFESIQQRKTTCLLSIRKSLACARASKLTTSMYIARARCESEPVVKPSGSNALSS